MKYYNRLNNLETELIRLETLTGLVSVITAGFDYSNPKDLQNSMHHIEDALKAVNNNIRQEFDELWDVIREDTHDYDEPLDDSFEEEYNDSPAWETDPGDLSEFSKDNNMASTGYNFKPVEEAVKTWIEP